MKKTLYVRYVVSSVSLYCIFCITVDLQARTRVSDSKQEFFQVKESENFSHSCLVNKYLIS